MGMCESVGFCVVGVERVESERDRYGEGAVWEMG